MTVAAQEKAKEDVAAAWYMAVIFTVFGFAGLLIAAVAVGVERAWSRRVRRDRRTAGSGWRETVADSQAWLDQDRKARARSRAARRTWWKAGADPARRPPAESWWKRTRRFWRWMWSWFVVNLDELADSVNQFAEGFADGWRAANEARRDGGSPGDIFATIPEAIAAGRDADADADDGDGDGDGDGGPDADGEGAPRPVELDTAAQDGPAVDEPLHSPPPAEPAPEFIPTPATASTNPKEPLVAETNLDLLAADLGDIVSLCSQLGIDIDALAALANRLEALALQAADRAEATGATAITRQALDAVTSVVAAMTAAFGSLAEKTLAAEEHTNAAITGLAPARDAQDQLEAAGARGEFVDAATA